MNKSLTSFFMNLLLFYHLKPMVPSHTAVRSSASNQYYLSLSFLGSSNNSSSRKSAHTSGRSEGRTRDKCRRAASEEGSSSCEGHDEALVVVVWLCGIWFHWGCVVKDRCGENIKYSFCWVGECDVCHAFQFLVFSVLWACCQSQKGGCLFQIREQHGGIFPNIVDASSLSRKWFYHILDDAYDPSADLCHRKVISNETKILLLSSSPRHQESAAVVTSGLQHDSWSLLIAQIIGRIKWESMDIWKLIRFTCGN